MGDVEPLTYNDIQLVLGFRHRHVEQPPFLFDFFASAGEIRRNAAVYRVARTIRRRTPATAGK